ncbi:MAG: DUF1292 domain-containing protein [Clostridia bacterium]|nr:DUF1292 domain-containing protein [Clostridia bacterium]
MEEMDNIIVMHDEEGNEEEFEYLDAIEYQGKEYVILVPADDSEEGEVVILEVEEIDEETEAYNSVEDQAILRAVFDLFKEKFKDEFEFED